MTDNYMGEIRMFAGNFAPAGWALCDGSLLPISEYDALFVLLGTTYGGDGQNTFALPDLRGRVPMHQGSGNVIGQSAGVESVTLTTNQIPVHNHAFICSTDSGGQLTPENNLLGTGTSVTVYRAALTPPTTPMSPSALQQAGGSQPHTNLQPYLCVNFIISLYGIFPSQN